MKTLRRHIIRTLLLLVGCSLAGCVGIHDDLDAGIVLVSQSQTVNILAGESFSFRVMSGNDDITYRSRIFEVTDSGRNPLDGTVYTPEREGAYTFIAECEGHLSPLLYLSATKVSPQGDRFLRKSLILDFTATWCVNCPAMAQAISEAAALSAGRIEKIAVYYLDDLQVPAGKALADRFGVQALPYVVSGLDATLATSVASADILSAHNRMVLEQDAPACGIVVTTTLSGSELSIDVEVTSAADGEYILGAALVEDGITAPQTGASGDYVHNSVLRSLLHATPPAEGFGDSLGRIDKGATKARTFTAAITGNPAATRIVVYLLDGEGRLNNVASCVAGQSQPYVFE